MKKYIFSLCALAVVLLPSLAFAYTAPSIPYWATNGLVSCTGNLYNVASTTYSANPNACTSLCDLINTIENVIYFGITIALFVILPILFAWGGLMFMFSRGKPEGISKAKGILTGAVVGLLIVLGAWLIVNTVVNALGIKGVGGFGTNICTVQSSPSVNTIVNCPGSAGCSECTGANQPAYCGPSAYDTCVGNCKASCVTNPPINFTTDFNGCVSNCTAASCAQ